jgi:hypothetical protein
MTCRGYKTIARRWPEREFSMRCMGLPPIFTTRLWRCVAPAAKVAQGRAGRLSAIVATAIIMRAKNVRQNAKMGKTEEQQ